MIDAKERAAMAATVHSALAAAVATAGDGAVVDNVLTELGWLQLLDDEPDDAIGIVFSAVGAANATTTALDDVVASALGQKPRAGLAVLLPRFGAWGPPGRIDAADFHAHGLATARSATAANLLVAGGTETEPWSVIVATASAEIHAVRGVDPHAGLRDVRVHGRAAGVERLEPGAWQSAVALGRRAIAHQIAGAGRTMLDLARAHAMEREQFGRPIARFQAVRHKLAETLVALEALEAALTAARDEPGRETAALAKALAGRTSRTVSRHCQQVLAGIGFTTDHRFHSFLKRAMVLEGLFGSADEIVLDTGRRLLATRRVPTLIEL